MKILILSPHMDDAFLSLGGFVSRLSMLHDFEILNIFSYDPWVLDDFKTTNKLENINIRKKEEMLNASIAGIKTNFLDLPAGWKERGYSKWQTNVDRKIDKKILIEVFNYLEKLVAFFDLIFSPLGIGGHVDHKLIRGIACKLTLSKIFYYEDLPYAVEKDFFRYVDNFRKKQCLLNHVFFLNNKEIKKKEVFVRNYKSQLTKEEMELVMRYTRGEIDHKISKTSSEIIWTYKDNIPKIKNLQDYKKDE